LEAANDVIVAAYYYEDGEENMPDSKELVEGASDRIGGEWDHDGEAESGYNAPDPVG
jgi:hypothetical protein